MNARTNPRCVTNAELVRRLVSEWTKSHTITEIVASISGKVSLARVNTAEDIFKDQHPKGPDLLVGQPGDVVVAECPNRFTTADVGIFVRAAKVGEHALDFPAEAGLAFKEVS